MTLTDAAGCKNSVDFFIININDVLHASVVSYPADPAVDENFELKRKLFHELDQLCSPETILVSNRI